MIYSDASQRYVCLWNHGRCLNPMNKHYSCFLVGGIQVSEKPGNLSECIICPGGNRPLSMVTYSSHVGDDRLLGPVGLVTKFVIISFIQR